MSETVENVENQEIPLKDPKNGHFLPGHKGVGGRPKGSGLSLTTMLRRKMQEVPIGQVKSYAEQLIENILESAIVQKDSQNVKLIMEYLEGKPRQNIGLDGGVEGAPIIVAVETEDMAKKAIQAFLNQDAPIEDAPSETNE
ncbi:MAG: hypothetical protein WC346_01350 [Methanogenium sp.]|jgi:hypothetical protein